MRSLLTKIDDTTDEINKMSIESELTICEHFDSLRQQVDIARETALENIHNASNTLMTEIEAYERECLAGWTTVRSSNELIAKDVSKRVRAFLDEQLAFLQRVQASDTYDMTFCFVFSKGTIQRGKMKKKYKKNTIRYY